MNVNKRILSLILNFIIELMQNIFDNETVTYLQIMNELFGLIKDIIWIIIFIVAFIGFIFWLFNNKYLSHYQLEKPSKPDFLANLLAKGIEGGLIGFSLFSYLIIKSLKFTLIFLIPIIPITYYFFGIKWVLFTLFFILMIWLKSNEIAAQILINDGLKNNNYISLTIAVNLIKKLIIRALDSIFSKKILLIYLSYFAITLVIFLSQMELFYLWASIWIIFYLLKLMVLHYKLKLMENPPLFVNIEYSTGDIIENMILYQTTSTDYRFKKKNSDEEYIIPYTSIIKIHLNYDFELNELDQLLKLDTLDLNHIEHPKYRKLSASIVNYLDNSILSMIKKSKPDFWYRKAIIYNKLVDFNGAEKCLGNAIKLDESCRDKAEKDTDFDGIRNEQWFIDLVIKKKDFLKESDI